MEQMYDLLARAIQEWIAETVAGAGVDRVVLGLSGGLDSCVSAALCAGALGGDNVLGIMMPCGNHPDDLLDGQKIAGFLGIHSRTVDLRTAFGELVKTAGLDPSDTLMMGNLKARLRMAVLYAHSRGRLVAGTSNRSEYLTGYWTKWGDGVADFHPLLDLYKDQVLKLAGTLGLPGWVTRRVPSAGLWPGQSDEGEMGVSYGEIRDYFAGGPGSVSPETAGIIGRLHGASGHKRAPIPHFDAERWFRDHG
jgi:NAD+ synthase